MSGVESALLKPIFVSSSSGLDRRIQDAFRALIKIFLQPLERLLDGPIKSDHDDVVFKHCI
jgi:hypothetical protein